MARTGLHVTIQRSKRFCLNPAWLLAAGTLAALAALVVVLSSNPAAVSPGDVKAVFHRQPGTEEGQEQKDARALRDVSKAVAAVAFPNQLKRAAPKNDLAELAALLMDSAQPVTLRRQAAWRLARLGSTEGVTVLRQALLAAPPALRAAITEALGHSGRPDAKTLLEGLIGNSDEATARGAARGLAAFRDRGGVATLSRVLSNADHGEGVRVEAALALGGTGSDDALRVLMDTALYSETPELTKAAVMGLGRRPFSQTREFFQHLMEPTNADVDLRALALESLGESDEHATDFVLRFLGAEEAEIRAAAAWALATMENPKEIALPLLTLLNQESNPEVRARLYQALENQTEFDPAPLFFTALGEGDITARIAAMNLIAKRLGAIGDPTMLGQFDRQMVPWLAEQALNGGDLQTQLSSVLALRLANTPAALHSLRVIATRSQSPKLIQAARSPTP